MYLFLEKPTFEMQYLTIGQVYGGYPYRAFHDGGGLPISNSGKDENLRGRVPRIFPIYLRTREKEWLQK